MHLGSASPSPETAFALREFIPRALQGSALVSHLQNAVPFLFDGDFGGIRMEIGPGEPDPRRNYLRDVVLAAANPEAELTTAEYFRLCLSAQWASLGSFMPTDGDNQVRFKLWNPALSTEEIREMAEIVLDAYTWDSTAISRRWIASPHAGLVLSAHHGEWFSVAVAAYVATRGRDPMLSTRLREAIEFEVTREAKIYLEFRKARDGVGMLLASMLISHNLTDLDRAIETWSLTAEDPVFEFAYRVVQAEGMRAARFGGALAEAGKMGKGIGASENHRHFALRTPRALRRSVELLLPMAPFFENWGKRLAAHASVTPAEIASIVEALVEGWEKRIAREGGSITYAYPRAVAGILSALPGGIAMLTPFLSPKVERSLRSGLFHSLVTVSEQAFRDQMNLRALGVSR
jgi:hypothetical protein